MLMPTQTGANNEITRQNLVYFQLKFSQTIFQVLIIIMKENAITEPF